MLDYNTFIFISVAVAFGVVGIVVWVADSGIDDKYKTLLMCIVGSVTVALIGLFFMIDDNSEFEYSSIGKMKRAGGQAPQRQSMTEDGGGGSPPQAGASEGGGGGASAAAADGTEGGDGANTQAGTSSGQGDISGAPGEGANSFKDCVDCPHMVTIPAGLALLGSTFQISSGGLNSAPAAQKNFHSPFSIGKYEVTVGEFQAFVKEMNYKPTGKCRRGDGSSGAISYLSPRFPQTTLHPVVCVNWIDAAGYASWLSGKTGRTYRLPTEAEWEYAARSGVTRPYMNGDQMNVRAANFRVRIGKQNSGTRKVGSYAPNGNGMYDIHGNAWEIVGDCWSQYYQVAALEKADPNNPHDCTRRIVKGGGWASPLKQTAFPMRGAIPENLATDSIGFRVMRVEPEVAPSPTAPDVDVDKPAAQ